MEKIIKNNEKLNFNIKPVSNIQPRIGQEKILKEAILEAVKGLDYRICDCGCKINVKYPYFTSNGEKFVKCPCCGKTWWEW